MIFPIGDDQVKGGAFPYVSYTFIAINVIVFLIQFMYQAEGSLICEFGCVPNEVVAGEDYLSLLTSMFMHGGWMHLIGNMLFLWVFADNIEATVGNFNFFGFYMMGGLFASLAHIYFSVGGDPAALLDCCSACSDISCEGKTAHCPGSIPSVGASGAISAVLGAYLVMFPKSQVKLLVLYLMQSFKIPALWFLGFWIAQQLFSGFMSLGPETAATGGTAWWAHIGGFVFGLAAGYFARDIGKEAWQPEPVAGGKDSSTPHVPPSKSEGKGYDDGDMV